jgi:tetratricopeptide (TPR) repeat protein
MSAKLASSPTLQFGHLVVGIAILIIGFGCGRPALSQNPAKGKGGGANSVVDPYRQLAQEAASLGQVAVPAELATTSLARAVSIRAQFEIARSCRNAAGKLLGVAKFKRLQDAVLAYQAVSRYWPGAGELQAEAAFRRGEIHLFLQQSGQAWGAFQQAQDLGSGTKFLPRALLQMGHIKRRRGQYGQAIALYARLRALPGLGLRQANDAREWLGKAWLDLGKWESAAAIFELWAVQAEGPLEALRAFDLQAVALVRLGRVPEAQKLLERLNQTYQGLASEDTVEARKLYRALRGMRAQELLAELEHFDQVYAQAESLIRE